METASREKPLFGIDVSEWQKGIDMARVKEEGYRFAFVKATEGPYRDGSYYLNPEYTRQIEGARGQGLVTGAYHFLTETDPEKQADLFLSKVRDGKDKVLIVDFEAYNPPFQGLTPSNTTLRAFIAQLRKNLEPRRHIVVYSSRGFWNGGTPSGNLDSYGTDLHAWDAMYRSNDPVADPKAHYRRVWRDGWGTPWGRRSPMAWQFTPAGRVAGRNIDVNAWRSSLLDLKIFAHGIGSAPSPPPPSPPPPSPPTLIMPGHSPHHSDGAGWYVQQHPTNYIWREDVRRLVVKYLNHPRLKGKVWINTYRNHPPIPANFDNRYDSVSFDVWDWRGRGHPLSPELRKAAFDVIFKDPSPPKIRWCISGGGMWTPYHGWQSHDPPEDGSDAGHWKHCHFTYF